MIVAYPFGRAHTLLGREARSRARILESGLTSTLLITPTAAPKRFVLANIPLGPRERDKGRGRRDWAREERGGLLTCPITHTALGSYSRNHHQTLYCIAACAGRACMLNPECSSRSPPIPSKFTNSTVRPTPRRPHASAIPNACAPTLYSTAVKRKALRPLTHPQTPPSHLPATTATITTSSQPYNCNPNPPKHLTHRVSQRLRITERLRRSSESGEWGVH